MNLADLGVAEIAHTVASGDLTAGQVLEDCLARIEERDPALNAFSVVLAEQARAEAAERDAVLEQGRSPGPLHGVPVAVKEEIDVAGCVTTFGGRANGTPAACDSEVVRRLRAAGAVVIGKTRMPEFGQWPFTESRAFGITRNPWHLAHTPGGSSGGSAAAVAGGMVPLALGGDGGGSIRIPAACCGLFGLKPTRGRVSTDPAPHLWFALGTVGPLTRSALDSALVYDVISGNLPGDRFTAPPLGSLVEAALAPPGPLRIGWSTDSATPGVRADLQSERAVRETARVLERLGHQVRRVDPHYPDPSAAFVPQFFGGVRAEAALVEHQHLLEPRTRQTCRLGAWARPSVVERAVRAGERMAGRVDHVFEEVDVLLTPTIAQRPPRVGALDDGGTVVQAWRARPMIAHTALWNATGHPAAAVPCGSGPDRLPLSAQLIGRRGAEAILISVAAQLEGARPSSGPSWPPPPPPGP